MMEAYLVYMAQTSLCLAVLYLPFRLWLRKEACFHANRYVLLGMTLLSFILPLLRFPWMIQETILRFPEITIVGKQVNTIEVSVYLSGEYANGLV